MRRGVSDLPYLPWSPLIFAEPRRFDEARQAWERGAAQHPEHEQLQAEVEALREYDGARAVDGTAAPAASGRVTATPLELSKGRRVFLSTRPLLDRATCARAIELCEAKAAAAGGWSTKRHTTVPTTDMEVRSQPDVLRLFNDACATAIFPAMAAMYAELGVSASALRVSDAFVVRYDAAAQRSLPTHVDDSHFSITIALNALAEYDGGGTYFEDLEGAVKPEQGHVVAFPGSLRHGGQPITRGRRYVIAAFLSVAGWRPPAHWEAT